MASQQRSSVWACVANVRPHEKSEQVGFRNSIYWTNKHYADCWLIILCKATTKKQTPLIRDPAALDPELTQDFTIIINKTCNFYTIKITKAVISLTQNDCEKCMNSTAHLANTCHMHKKKYPVLLTPPRKRDGGQIVMLTCTSAFTISGVLWGKTNFWQTAHFSNYFLSKSTITNDKDGLMNVQ